MLGGEADRRRVAGDCRLDLPRDGNWEVQGRFLGRVEPGRAAPFRPEAGIPGGCRETLRAWWPADLPAPATGTRLELSVRWEGRAFPDPGRGEWAGRLRVRSDPAPRVSGERGQWPGPALRVRGAVQDRIHRLWGERASMVEALVLARREHLDPELRAAFARSGTAHLLAISGFHVGVVAGLLLATFRMAGARPRKAAALAAAGSWLYVLGIGAPDAALRAAVLLTLLAAARARGVPAVPVGTLSTAFIGLLVASPGSLASVGFQLSFAGTLGLVTLRRPVERSIQRLWIAAGGKAPRAGPAADPGERWLRGSSEGVAAGVAATLPTLPLLAWHFDQVSVVGVVATLTASPVVALAIPGIGAALLLSVVSPPLGDFLAGGVGLMLAIVEALVRWWAAWPGAALWVSRPALLASVGAGCGTTVLLARAFAGRIRAPTRRVLGTAAGTVAVLLLPLLPGGRTLDLHLMDVGQGDAVAVRLPGGSWIAVDAGPASAGWDAGARRVVPYLRRHGVRRLEALVLTHAHLDHLGGAASVLRGLPVRGVLEPGRVTASAAYLATLEAGRETGTAWWVSDAGARIVRDGVEIHVLHPSPPRRDPASARAPDEGPGTDPNRVSVVLLLQWGDASILLTGDAYAEVELALLPLLPSRLTVLKAGHHGSRTSTSAELLDATRPAVVAIPVGDGNRYGHPHPEVVERIEARGAVVYRTDRDGSFRIRIRRDGRWSASPGR